jgi:hypothetical protein
MRVRVGWIGGCGVGKVGEKAGVKEWARGAAMED